MFEHQLLPVRRLALGALGVAALFEFVEPDVEVTRFDEVGGFTDDLFDDRLQIGVGQAEGVGARLQQFRRVLVSLYPVGVARELEIGDDLHVVPLRRREDLFDVGATERPLAPREGRIGVGEVVGEGDEQRVVLERPQHVDHMAEAVDLIRVGQMELKEDPPHFEVGPVGDAAAFQVLRRVAVAEHHAQGLHTVI